MLSHAQPPELDEHQDMLMDVSQQPPAQSPLCDPQRLQALLAVQEKRTTALSAEQQLQLMQQVRQRLQLFGTGQDRDHTLPEAWLQQQLGLLLDPANFRAGITRQHLPAWQALLQGESSAAAKQALQFIAEGVVFEFVHPEAPSQQAHPRHAQLMADMHELLAAEHGPEQAQRMLNSDTPQPAVFQNRASVTSPQNQEFLWSALTELRAWGVLKTPEELGMTSDQVVIVAGMAIITNRVAKQRLIYDARFSPLCYGLHLQQQHQQCGKRSVTYA